jgi:N-acetyl-anhydromuramyl-L-alanine amidase AmpD
VTLTAAEIPGALWVPAYPGNYRVGRPDPWNLIVIHCTDGHGPARGTAEMFAGKLAHPASAHVIVGELGEAIQCVALGDTAFHAHSANARAVGIEHGARTPHELGPNDPGLRPSDALYGTSSRIVAWLLKQRGLTPSRDVIKGHAEADPTTTHSKCPTGCGWDWDRYMALVAAAFSAV